MLAFGGYVPIGIPWVNVQNLVHVCTWYAQGSCPLGASSGTPMTRAVHDFLFLVCWFGVDTLNRSTWELQPAHVLCPPPPSPS